MDAASKIVHDAAVVENDALRFGLQGVKSDLFSDHPLQSARRTWNENEGELKRSFFSNTYGSAFPLRMDLDRQILSRFQRPPGPIPSSMLGLEALTGSLDEFGFEDYLNDPRESENVRPSDMHHAMEFRLGLTKGPICPSFF